MSAPSGTQKRSGSAPKYDWDSHKEKIMQLYEQKGYQHMASEMKKIGFTPSRRAYLNKLKKWGIEKNIPSTKMKFMAEKTAKRKAEDKDTVFIWQGKHVPARKIERFQRRQKNDAAGETPGSAACLGDAPTPDGITWRSPSPPVAEDIRSSGSRIAEVLEDSLAKSRETMASQESNSPSIPSHKFATTEIGISSVPTPQKHPSKIRKGNARKQSTEPLEKQRAHYHKTGGRNTVCDENINSFLAYGSLINPADIPRSEMAFLDPMPDQNFNPWTHNADPFSMLNGYASFDDAGWLDLPRQYSYSQGQLSDGSTQRVERGYRGSESEPRRIMCMLRLDTRESSEEMDLLSRYQALSLESDVEARERGRRQRGRRRRG